MLQATTASPVTLPVFAPSSIHASSSRVSTGGGPTTSGLSLGEGWQMESSGPNDTMDFDLLAEYLLDDTQAGAGSAPFDFNSNSTGGAPNGSLGVVSPEQSDDGGMPPVAEGPATALASSPTIPPPQQPQNQQTTLFVAQQQQQQQQLAAAPPAALTSPLVPPQLQVPIPPLFAAHSSAHLAPAIPTAVAAPAASFASNPVPQQISAKRRRIDGSVAPELAPQMTPVLNDPIAVAAALQGRGRKKTQAQIDRRRERNRILARRTRLRKKFFFESLQKEVMDLQRENAALKDIVRVQLSSDEGNRLLEECDAVEKLPSAVLEACGEQVADMDQQDFNLVKSIQQSQHCFIITDPSLQDNPIVFASDDFLSLTGYSREDVLGRNCRFLQGTNTSDAKVSHIRKGIASGDDVSVTLVNYTADGTPFWNKLFIAALRDAQNNIVNFIGVIVKVASPEPDDPEHGVKLPGEVGGGDVETYASDPAVMVTDGALPATEGAGNAASEPASGGRG